MLAKLRYVSFPATSRQDVITKHKKDMSKVTDTTGKQAEAFDLIMRKEFALQIVEGVKRLEFRSLSDFYISRFMHQEPDGELYYKDHIEYLHFHDYNKSWFLDVHIEPIQFKLLHPSDAGYFHSYGHYEMDQDIEEFADKDPDKESDEIPGFFCIPIDAIINTSLADLDELRKEGPVPVMTIDEAAIRFADRLKVRQQNQ